MLPAPDKKVTAWLTNRPFWLTNPLAYLPHGLITSISGLIIA
jgi:hypothetical protein